MSSATLIVHLIATLNKECQIILFGYLGLKEGWLSQNHMGQIKIKEMVISNPYLTEVVLTFWLART